MIKTTILTHCPFKANDKNTKLNSTYLLLSQCHLPHYMETPVCVCSSQSSTGTVYDASNIGPVQKKQNKKTTTQKINFKNGTEIKQLRVIYQYILKYIFI